MLPLNPFSMSSLMMTLRLIISTNTAVVSFFERNSFSESSESGLSVANHGFVLHH